MEWKLPFPKESFLPSSDPAKGPRDPYLGSVLATCSVILWPPTGPACEFRAARNPVFSVLSEDMELFHPRRLALGPVLVRALQECSGGGGAARLAKRQHRAQTAP